MRQLGIDDDDRELVQIATRLLRDRFSPGEHHVAVALRCADGSVYTGLHVGSRRIDICAEAVALGAAMADGHTSFRTCAAVIKMTADDEPTVTSPCGVCRELLNYYEPELQVLAVDHARVVKTTVGDLLPAPWLLPEEVVRPDGAGDDA
jgi:cytidine deaminase